MYEITSSIYLDLAERLVEAVRDKEFFSGAVVCYDGDLCCRLVCTLIIGRDDNPTHRAIRRLIPVWWELQTTIGQECVDNDFSFEYIRKIVLGE